MNTQRTVGLVLTIASLALGVMCATIIQDVTFGGYVFELGLALAGASTAGGVFMIFARA